MDYAVVTSLLGVVEQQLFRQPHPCLILPADTEIIPSLKKNLLFLQAYLQESDNREHAVKGQKLLNEGIRDVAAEAEDKIESRLSEVYLAAAKGEHASVEAACQHLHHTLQQVMNDIESVKVRLRDLQITHTAASLHDASPSAPSLDIRDGGFSKYHIEYENIMGLKDGIEKIRYASGDGNKELEVISIVGMGGAGKSTLAQEVYKICADMFEIRAWITVSQEFSMRKLLIAIMGCILSLTSEILEADTEDLADRLGKILKSQRYLIVIDDIRTTELWGDLQTCFPNSSNESRILITTRMMEVAEYSNKSNSSNPYIFNMPLLSSDESWHLFVKKLRFNNGESFPFPELEPIGRKIVEKCCGLPLAIGLIAGLVAKLERSPKQWEDFAQNINSTLMGVEHDSVSEIIIALCYNNLSGYLRGCFLYLGIFPGDEFIPVKKLVKLWVAEGFLNPMMNKSLEEVAMESLCDLITRNLVLVEKISFGGKVKLCRLPDLVRDFCLRKAQEENTLVVSNGDHGKVVAGSEQSKIRCCRWMSSQSHHWPITRSGSLNYTWGKIRSILHFGKGLDLAKCRFKFPCLKLLRVLDLSSIKYGNGMPSEIVNLIHLRYLALTTAGSVYDFQLIKLQSLQTLILFSWMKECHLQLPCNILDLPWIRHVHLDKGSSLYLPNSIQGNLQTLFWLRVACWDAKTIPDFTRVPNLKELGIYIVGKMSSNALDSLSELHQLERLKCEMGRVEQFCLPISFPPSIKKLTLRSTYLAWEKMDIIGKLPNLEILKLKDSAFCGSKWEPKDGGFQRLKFLAIARLDLEHWNAGANCFPVLEYLVLGCCWCLNELPSDLSKIHTLRLIKLIDCPSAKHSVVGWGAGIVQYFSTKDENSEEENYQFDDSEEENYEYESEEDSDESAV